MRSFGGIKASETMQSAASPYFLKNTAVGNIFKATLIWLKLVHNPICIKNPYKTILFNFSKKHSRNSKLKNCSLAKGDHCCYFIATTAPHTNTVPGFTAPQRSNLVYRHQVNGEFPGFRALFLCCFLLKELKIPWF